MHEERSATPEATPPPPPELWRVVLARLSLALGLLSCFTCTFGILSGIPAILLGVTARKNLPRTGRHAPGVRVAKAGIVLGSIGVAIAFMCFLILPALSRGGSFDNPTCQNNLKQIGICLKMYAGENQGALPDRFSTLYPEYVGNPGVFVCPLSGNKPGDPAHIDEWSDYTYVHGLRKTGTTADADALICYECEYRHTPRGRNELYLDGHVEFRELGKPPHSTQASRP